MQKNTKSTIFVNLFAIIVVIIKTIVVTADDKDFDCKLFYNAERESFEK